MSPTAKYFLKDVSKKIELLLVGDGTQDIADIYYAEPVADKVKIGIDHFYNKCSHCGQYGKYHTACVYCGAPIE